jgi:hypothetical protein
MCAAGTFVAVSRSEALRAGFNANKDRLNGGSIKASRAREIIVIVVGTFIIAFAGT